MMDQHRPAQTNTEHHWSAETITDQYWPSQTETRLGHPRQTRTITDHSRLWNNGHPRPTQSDRQTERPSQIITLNPRPIQTVQITQTNTNVERLNIERPTGENTKRRVIPNVEYGPTLKNWTSKLHNIEKLNIKSDRQTASFENFKLHNIIS